MPHIPGSLHAVRHHSGNSPWLAITRNHYVDGVSQIFNEAKELSGRPMAQDGISPCAEQCRPQQCFAAWGTGKGRVYATLQALPAAGPQQSLDGARPEPRAERLLASDHAVLQPRELLTRARYVDWHKFSVGPMSIPRESYSWPCGKPRWNLRPVDNRL